MFVSDNDTRIAQEEIFGPVLTVVPYSGEDEDAVRLANDSIYGLGGGVVSASTSRAFNVGRRIRAGSVTVQGVGAEAAHVHRPGAGQGPGWGSTRRASASRARSVASSSLASAASGGGTASRTSPRSRTSSWG